MRAVRAKREKLVDRARKPRRIERFLEQRPIPAVMGPRGRLYMIDRHHMSVALWQTEITDAFVQVIADFSTFGPQRFWRSMEAHGWLHPFDERGRRISPGELPRSVDGLRADAYRDLAWAVRERGGFNKSAIAFAEFHWARYFRRHIEAATVHEDFRRAVRLGLTLAADERACRLPGYIER